MEASTGRTSLLIVRLSMPAEALKPMDGEMQSVFFYFVNVRYGILLLLFAFFEGMLCSMEWLS
jgi:hypothetical protein